MSWSKHKLKECGPECWYCMEEGKSAATHVDPDTYKQLINDYKEANNLPLNKIDKPTGSKGTKVK